MRRGLCVGVVLVAALAHVLVGCGSIPDRGGPAHRPDLAPTLASLRDPVGFFVDPVYFDSRGSAYSTALLLDELHGDALALSAEEARRLCSSDERMVVGEPWFSWSMARIMGRDAPCLVAEAPQTLGEPSHDIPLLFAWAESRLTAGEDRDHVLAIVGPALARGGHDASPYVMWRLDQLEDLLSLPSTAEARSVDPPGPTIETPSQLWDFWGYTMRCGTRQRLCSGGVRVSAEDAARAAVSFSDDISLAGALAIARVAGDGPTLNALRRDVALRRVNHTGLVRHQWFSGTIDATFEVLRLAPELFPGPDPALMTDDLLRRLEVLPASNRVQRLRALAILKAIDPSRWEGVRSEVDQAWTLYQSSVITRATLHSFLDASAAFSAMNLDVPRPRLEQFSVTDAPSEYDALVAAGHAWAFSNDGDILATHQDLRRRALEVASEPSEPVMVYAARLQALNGAEIGLTQEKIRDIRSALDRSLKGCALNGKPAMGLYRFNLDPASTCSLRFTVSFIHSGFGG